MADAVRERPESEEQPFTLQGYRRSGGVDLGLGGPPISLPPKKVLGSCNYWQLDEQIIANMAISLTPTDPSVPVFKLPHAYVEGTVNEIIHEQDGDTHVWLALDSSKMRLACEWTPQTNIDPPPAVGTRIGVYGIWRYDFQHAWWELHPVDHWEAL